MPLSVREIDLKSDRRELIDALRSHLNPRTDEARLRWLYEDNPHGTAKVWGLIDADVGNIIGSCAALPRVMYVKGLRTLGCVLADFWVHPMYRYLAPAAKLQRTCLESISNTSMSVAYDLPHASMIAVYMRLRICAFDELITASKIIRVDRWLRTKRMPQSFRVVLSTSINRALAVSSRWSRSAARSDIGIEMDQCDEEYTRLAHSMRTAFDIQVARTSEYLNWRFRSHFFHSYEFLVARRQGRLCGYLILLDDPVSDQLSVIDGLVGPSRDVWRELLDAAVEVALLRERSVVAISLLSRDSRLAEARRAKFAERSRAPLLVMGLRPGHYQVDHSIGIGGFTLGDEAD